MIFFKSFLNNEFAFCFFPAGLALKALAERPPQIVRWRTRLCCIVLLSGLATMAFSQSTAKPDHGVQVTVNVVQVSSPHTACVFVSLNTAIAIELVAVDWLQGAWQADEQAGCEQAAEPADFIGQIPIHKTNQPVVIKVLWQAGGDSFSAVRKWSPLNQRPALRTWSLPQPTANPDQPFIIRIGE